MSQTRFGGFADLSADVALTEGVLARRVLAFAVDWLLVAILCATLWVVLLTFGLLTLGLGLPLLGLIPVVPLLYNWLSLLTGSSATPGQAAFGLAVRRDDDLGPPTGLQALLWSAGYLITISLGAIWFAVALVTTRHRTLHDLVSGLVVVRAAAMTEALTGPAPIWNSARGGTAFE